LNIFLSTHSGETVACSACTAVPDGADSWDISHAWLCTLHRPHAIYEANRVHTLSQSAHIGS